MLKEITIRNGNAKESRVPTRDTMFQMAMACQGEFKGGEIAREYFKMLEQRNDK